MYDQRLTSIEEIMFGMRLTELPGEVEDRDDFPFLDEPLDESETHNPRARQEVGPS